MTLDYAFKTMLFWIVSRGNNCIYCMGHQEAQLPAFGVAEDRIAALDGDWSEFTHSERAAFAVARKLTIARHRPSPTPTSTRCARHFKDIQVQEIIGIVAGFNAMNRWTGPLRLTQQDFRLYLTPTSPKYATGITKVGPVPPEVTGADACAAANPRPPLESRSAVEAKWAECQKRKPRFCAGGRIGRTSDAARGHVPVAPAGAELGLPPAQLPQSRTGQGRRSDGLGDQRRPVAAAQRAARLGVGPGRPRLVRAGHARDRLRALGLDDDAIFAIDQANESKFTPAERGVRLRAETDGRSGADRRCRLRRLQDALQRVRDRRADPLT